MSEMILSVAAQDAMFAEAYAEAKRQYEIKAVMDAWPKVYVNAETKREYHPHPNPKVNELVESDTPRYVLFRGGEGGGKSVGGIVKVLEKVRRGMSGILVSPDLTHFVASLWPEFKRWCPWDMVIDNHQRMNSPGWLPQKNVSHLVFKNGATIMFGGIDDPGKWEGPNVNWAMIDEARNKRTAEALKVLDGRIRINGPNGEPPQLWLTTTPRKHWLFEYFGGLDNISPDDPRAGFKQDAADAIMLTRDNQFVQKDFVEKRAQSLSVAEQKVLLEAEWEDLQDVARFVASMTWWNNGKVKLPPMNKHEPLVLGLDAATKNDYFALVAVTRLTHVEGWNKIVDTEEHANKCVAVRHIYYLAPKGGQPIPHKDMRAEIDRLCREFNVMVIAFDSYQLHTMMQEVQEENGVWTDEFNQGTPRIRADMGLHNDILEKRVFHSGETELTKHIDNADRKHDADHKKYRIVKREDCLKVDLAVALSMARQKCLELEY